VTKSAPLSGSSAQIGAGRWWTVTAFYACLIAIVSVIPIPPSTPKPLLSLDKVVHLCEYGLLAWLLLVSARRSAWTVGASLLTAFMGAAAYGALWEGVQAFLPYRSAEVGDLIANTLGAGIGVTVAVLATRPLGIRE